MTPTSLLPTPAANDNTTLGRLCRSMDEIRTEAGTLARRARSLAKRAARP